MKRIALTGGIASGKSSVASILKELGAEVIDADQVAHFIYQNNEALKNEVVQHFGKCILDTHNNIDRKKLGGIVFSDKSQLQWLESRLHPAIRKSIDIEIQRLALSNPPLVIIEAALMVESGYYKHFDGLLLVTSNHELQTRRAVLRDKLREDEIRIRIDSQWPDHEKRKVANWIIENTGSREDLEIKVNDFYKKLLCENEKN